MKQEISKKRLYLLLGLLAIVLVWSLLPPKSKELTKPAKGKAAAEKMGFASHDAFQIIVGRNIFEAQLKEQLESDLEPEPGFPSSDDFFAPLLPESEPEPHRPAIPGEPPPIAPSPFAGIELRGIVESSKGRLALLSGPDFAERYVTAGEQLGKVRLEKISADSVELSAGNERKSLSLPREFSVEPLGAKKGGGQ